MRKTAISIFLAATLAVSLAACTPSTDDTAPNPAPAPTETTDDNSSTPSPDITLPPDNIAEGGSQDDLAAQSFPNVEATELHTKEEVQHSLLMLTRYIQQAYNDTYLINGTWFAEDAPVEKVATKYDNYYTESFTTDLLTMLTEARATGDFEELRSLFLFIDSRDGVLTAPENCAGEQTTATCLDASGITISNYLYGDTEEGDLSVDLEFSVTPRLNQNFEDGRTELGQITFDYKGTFTLVENPFANDTPLAPDFVINGFSGGWESTPWEPAES